MAEANISGVDVINGRAHADVRGSTSAESKLESSGAVAQSFAHVGIEVLRPGEEAYVARQDSYWSMLAKNLQPAYIVRPKSTEEVSQAIKIIVSADRKFAIRSGGHTQYAGANNINDGVTLDLGLLDRVQFNEASETVDIGTGGRWAHVYGELAKYGRVVSGGRDGNVGVGGIILGGGYTFFAAKRGFACDDVVAFEVVLADGSVVTADASNHQDLFRALKGGSNNFGVVTNIKMNAIKSDQIWGGLNFLPKRVAPDAIAALVDFTENCHLDEDSHLLFFFTYLGIECKHWPTLKETVIVAAYVQLAGVERAPAYDKFLQLPATMDTTKMTTVASVVSEYDIAPQGYYNTFFTLSVKNDPEIVAKASELHDELVEELRAFIPDGDFITQCLVQPLPRHYGQKSASTTGNIMGVENQPVNGLLFVAVVMVKTPAQEAFAYAKVQAWVNALRAFASNIENGILPWVYMNYADKSQAVLQSYGSENVARMRQVAAQYDPNRVFQRLCPGGFKLDHVND